VSGNDLPRTQVVCSYEDLIRVQDERRKALRVEGLDEVRGPLNRRLIS